MADDKLDILVAEDSPTQAGKMRLILEGDGHKVTLALNGREALEALKEHRPDVVITDIIMPEIDGYELCRAIKADEGLKDIPVIILTMLSDPLDIIRGMECGADNFVAKQYEAENILYSINKLFEHRRLRRTSSTPRGLDVLIEGEHHVIDSSPERILDFLLSIYEITTRNNAELQREIAERKRAEETLRESEERFRSITSTAKDAIIMIDNDADISYWNPAAEEMFGYSRRETIGRELHMLIAPEKFHDAYRKGFAAFKDTGKGAAIGKTLELEGIRKDGTEFPIELSLSAIQMDEGWHAIGIVRDITERKRAEEELRIKDSAMASSVSAMAIMDLEGKLTYLNDSCLELWGFGDREEALRKPVLSFWESEEKILEMGKALLDKGYWTGEIAARKKDGSTFDTYLSATLVKDDSGRIVCTLGSFIDITERKRAEEELRAVNQELEAFAHTISHDLRTPLTAIFGYARTLQMMAPEALGEKEGEWVELIAQSAQRMNEFIESILEYARAGKAAGESVRVEPEEDVRQIILEREEIIEAKGVEMAVGEDFPPILVDPIKLSQVLSNLVDNALKYIGDDNPHSRIEIGASREDETVALYVADNGMGIPPEKQETIFEPFTRLEGVESQPGLGIGLCTVKRAVEAWEGEVWVESEPGKGATFFFTAPSA